MHEAIAVNSEYTWVFGYGSLIWRTGFDFAEKRPAFIHGWTRRFWQGSTDHRGVPEAPGRVVTLIEAPGEICWGKAYRLKPESRETVLAHLDHREKGGYERVQLALYFNQTEFVEGIMYHATEHNPNYLGHADHAAIVKQIAASSGPSGHNVEYVLRLNQALLKLGAKDEHVTRIASALLHLEHDCRR